MQTRHHPSNHPLRSLLFVFLAWKSLLLLIAAASPGPGYDTSASLFLGPRHEHVGKKQGDLPASLRYLLEKLTKWDAIYFVKVAHRGYLFEQEWAFGWGFTRLIALCVAGIKVLGIHDFEGLEALVGVIVAHVSHLLSVLVLFALGIQLLPSRPPNLALIAAILHVISPAGIFLSAPFAESSCALLTFSGVLLFSKSIALQGQPTAWHDLLVLLSGISFGIATTFRSNGILTGLLLLEEAFRVLFSLQHNFSLTAVRRLVATGLGGLSVGAGFIVPQFIAWNEYCHQTGMEADLSRTWCQNSLPSIYSFVQGHYWNLGFFRYWTLSNLPLFLLAAPMICMMTVSGIWAMKDQTRNDGRSSKLPDRDKEDNTLSRTETDSKRFPIIRNLAVSQLILTLLTLTSAHVQIITRISSSYPIWLWYLSALVSDGTSRWAGKFVKFMVIYAVVQGGLFASFLPPA